MQRGVAVAPFFLECANPFEGFGGKKKRVARRGNEVATRARFNGRFLTEKNCDNRQLEGCNVERESGVLEIVGRVYSSC